MKVVRISWSTVRIERALYDVTRRQVWCVLYCTCRLELCPEKTGMCPMSVIHAKVRVKPVKFM